MVTTHYMDEAEHCQGLLPSGWAIGGYGSPQEIKVQQMHGQVLEVACDQPDGGHSVLRRLGVFEEVALYGVV